MQRNRGRRGLQLLGALATVVARPRCWGPFLEAFQATGFDHAFAVSFSQGGEDLALTSLVGPRAGRYLDVGAHDPSRFSVTRLLHQRGWSGVNVEANPHLLRRFHDLRPADTNVNAFVGDPRRGSTRPLHIFEEPALSTGNPAWQERFEGEGQKIIATENVRVLSLGSIANEYFPLAPPNLLNVDAEGSDLEILETADWSTFRPDWVCVESPPSVAAALQSDSVRLLVSCAYSPWVVLQGSTILRRDQ